MARRPARRLQGAPCTVRFGRFAVHVQDPAVLPQVVAALREASPAHLSAETGSHPSLTGDEILNAATSVTKLVAASAALH